jgi:hypothetical protein
MSPRRKIPEKKQETGLPTLLIVAGIAVLAIGAVIVGVDFMSKMTLAAPAPSVTLNAASRTKGDPNAKIELVEYSDFQ